MKSFSGGEITSEEVNLDCEALLGFNVELNEVLLIFVLYRCRRRPESNLFCFMLSQVRSVESWKDRKPRSSLVDRSGCRNTHSLRICIHFPRCTHFLSPLLRLGLSWEICRQRKATKYRSLWAENNESSEFTPWIICTNNKPSTDTQQDETSGWNTTGILSKKTLLFISMTKDKRSQTCRTASEPQRTSRDHHRHTHSVPSSLLLSHSIEQIDDDLINPQTETHVASHSNEEAAYKVATFSFS